jgi:periplasmic protein TonB
MALMAEAGVSKFIKWSIGLHTVAIVLAFVVPREWLVAKKPNRAVMSISLGGSSGQKTTGTTPMGGRTIEEVAPQPRRPEPIKRVDTAKPVAPTPAPPRVAPPVSPPRISDVAKPALPPVTRPPVTGAQVKQGNTAIETGATGLGAGLTFGREGTGGETNLADFCCPEYARLLTTTIESFWAKDQPERGVTVVKFTIQKNGTIVDVSITERSGSGQLDRAALRAIELTKGKLPPLPQQYTGQRLIINLRFPYGEK